jgi:hypothetical protein
MVIFGRTSALLLAMVTPLLWAGAREYLALVLEAKNQFSPRAMPAMGPQPSLTTAPLTTKENPQAVNDFSSSPGALSQTLL